MPVAPDGRPLADFGTRLLAHLIDGAILTGVAMVILVPVIFLLFSSILPEFTDSVASTDPEASVDAVFTSLFAPLLLVEAGFVLLLLAGYYVYYVEMMYRSGQTVGKKVMKLRVVPLQPGATLTRGMAAKRYLVEFPAAVVLPFFTYVDGLWQLWDKPYQQTLHDKAAGTVVIKVAP